MQHVEKTYPLVHQVAVNKITQYALNSAGWPSEIGTKQSRKQQLKVRR